MFWTKNRKCSSNCYKSTCCSDPSKKSRTAIIRISLKMMHVINVRSAHIIWFIIKHPGVTGHLSAPPRTPPTLHWWPGGWCLRDLQNLEVPGDRKSCNPHDQKKGFWPGIWRIVTNKWWILTTMSLYKWDVDHDSLGRFTIDLENDLSTQHGIDPQNLDKTSQ